MKKRYGLFGMVTGIALAVCVCAEEEEVQSQDQGSMIEHVTAAIDAGRLEAAREWIVQIQEPAARLYLEARIKQAAGDVQQALHHAASVVTFHHRDAPWAERAEWLCAKLYREAGMLDAAIAVARQMQGLYAGQDIAEEAEALRLELEREQDRNADEETEGRT